MVKFVEVDPDEVPNIRDSHRGRVSYPILKSFMELNKPLVMLDRTGMQQSYQALYSSLTAYIRSHELPIKLFSRGGQMYLLRLDLDDHGNKVELPEEPSVSSLPFIDEEIEQRFVEEHSQTNK